MNSGFILGLGGRKRYSAPVSFSSIVMLTMMMIMMIGCSPQYDWRVIRDDLGGSAMFPGKPVEVTRPISIAGLKDPVELTLRSAKISETLFTIGSIPKANESTRRAIEAAMLANIQAKPESVERSTVVIQGLAYIDVKARGEMRLAAGAPPVEARLWMRSATLTDSADVTGRVVEALVVGPAAEWSDEQAEQFMSGFKPRSM
jgi:hypothetical protein